MGYEIVYCATCQAQLRGPDFEAGTAFRQEGIAYCDKCAPTSLKTAATRKQETSSVRQNPPTTRLHARSSDTRRSTRTVPLKRSRAPAILAVSAAVAAVVAVLVFVALAGSGEASKPPPPAKATKNEIPPAPPARKKEPSKEEEAARELERLLALPGDSATRLKRLEEFESRTSGTFAAAKARAKMNELDPPPSAPKETVLFNGKDLTAWQTVAGEPRVEEGELRIREDDGVMRRLDHPDFELTGLIRLSLTTGTAGIGFRRPGETRGVGSRFVIYGDGDVHFWHSNVRRGRAKAGTFKMNRWHEFRLSVRGETVVLDVDGRAALQVKTPLKEPGHLALYCTKVRDGGRVAFKDLRLRR